MKKAKQIEEMAEDIGKSDFCKHLPKELCNKRSCSQCTAEIIYEAGYRKQSEGKWILTQEKRLFGDKYYTCSNCQSINPTMIKFNYCFYCGAKMKGD